MQTQSNTAFNIVELGLAARAAVFKATPPEMLCGADRELGWPTMVCADGFHMSVQAGKRKFSTPAIERADHYSHVEVAFVSHDCPHLSSYGDADEGIYHFVPVEVVETILREHGGLDLEATVAYRMRLLNINKRTLLN